MFEKVPLKYSQESPFFWYKSISVTIILEITNQEYKLHPLKLLFSCISIKLCVEVVQ